MVYMISASAIQSVRYKKLQLAEKIGIKTFYDLHNYWTSISAILDLLSTELGFAVK